MNTERILQLADAIANEDCAGTNVKFDMGVYYAEGRCETVACIGGWATILAGEDPRFGASHKASDWLGLTAHQAGELFEPNIEEHFSDVTREQAITVLRNLAATGKVDWTVAGLTPTED